MYKRIIISFFSLFLLIGSAHVKVMKDFFRDHPYFEIVEAKKIFGAKNLKTSNAKTKKSVK